jgi:hypothetical protein
MTDDTSFPSGPVGTRTVARIGRRDDDRMAKALAAEGWHAR